MGGRAISIFLICLVLVGCSAGADQMPHGSNRMPELIGAATLQRAAEEALGDVEGSVMVIDPNTGLLRAVVNPRLAVEQSFPPGSAIKPFTLLAATRSGLVDPAMRHVCRTRYEREDFSIVCSHPPSDAPLTADQALAWSCNDFFARVGERLSEGTFNGLLDEFGFGRRTGIVAAENPGQIKPGEWKVAHALGEGDALLVTPLQLLIAYSALLNGGKLVRPSFSEDQRYFRRLNIPSRYRDQLVKGMRGAVRYGTASKAGLARLPALGKTGTSTSSNGFRSHGWFVCFDDDPPGYGVLVFIRRGNGAKAAAVAGKFFERMTGLSGTDRALVSAASTRDRMTVRVRSVSENRTRELPLEEYLIGVLAGEAGAETQIEALKAQAVVSRSFASRNAGRHAGEGYDFCSTTHCQRFVASGRNNSARRAVAATSGLILVDQRGEPIDAYFHAACGGHTADIETLWGVRPAPAYLRGVRDDYCSAMPHRTWRQTIAVDSLRRALESDERSAAGARLKSIRIIRRDAGGRARRLVIEGERRVELSGWEFKMIIGRSLGWQMIKSSSFEVARSGNGFVFRGRGFGHGLGLCQEGAHGAALRGLSFKRILDHYFPGTRLAEADLSTFREDHPPALVEAAISSPGPRQSFDNLASENFRLKAATGPLNPSPETALQILERAYRDLESRFRKAGIPLERRRPFKVVAHASTDDFITATGLSGWSAGATSGDTIQLQPLEILRKRRIFETTLRHELAHAVIEQIGNGRTPRWLAEGLAVHFAGESTSLPDIGRMPRISRREIETALATPKPHREMRTLYARAYREVRDLIRRHGEEEVWQMAARQ